MNTLPRILLIDDVYGRIKDGRNKHREDFCLRLGLIDMTNKNIHEEIENPIAEVAFCCGQYEESGYVYNDLNAVLKTIKKGWIESVFSY